jgi:uncharacterized phage protein (TIGR02220 family)
VKRPSLQFYPADWRNNAKLRRSSFHDRGVWLEVMCLMHDSDEYGVLRWPLEEVANAAGCREKDLHALIGKEVLKGADAGQTCAAYIHIPRHAGKAGEPVILIPEQQGPVWYSSRMVLDEWNRTRRGGATRFTADNNPNRSPNGRIGEIPTGTPDQRQGDGVTTSTSSTTTKESKALSGKPDDARLESKIDYNATARSILSFLNEKTQRRYQPVPANLELIVARLKSGATEQECRQVIALKCREWLGNAEMATFLRPETLFGRRKFAQYQGELGASE